MIRIQRLPCPEILQTKAAKWMQSFLEKRAKQPGCRPPRGTYAHQDILDVLAAMSHRKCFYCETRLSEDEYTVDHYVEVSEEPSQAFVWENLYLSCRGCQGKLPEKTVPRADCMNPCDPGVDPAEHLAFDKDIIRARNGSHAGMHTIRKYKLARGDLELKRARQLQLFHEAYIAIQERMNADGRKDFTADEAEALRQFQQPDSPYSLMFRCLLSREDFQRRLSASRAPEM